VTDLLIPNSSPLHVAEKSQLQLRKRRKCNDDKDLLIEQLLKQFSDGQITQMDLAIQGGLALKTSYVK